jgi:myo-inositol-1(or 4)-monophosphatase
MGDEILAGAVYAPLLNELYTATVDGPARCNGDIVHVSDTAGLAEAIVCSGMDKSPDTDIPPYTMVERFAANVQRVRILGSAALDLCQVARGAADGYWESGIYIWDVAAAGLIVRRAGGRAEILDRLDDGRLSFLASNAALYEPLQRLISGG